MKSPTTNWYKSNEATENDWLLSAVPLLLAHHKVLSLMCMLHVKVCITDCHLVSLCSLSRVHRVFPLEQAPLSGVEPFSQLSHMLQIAAEWYLIQLTRRPSAPQSPANTEAKSSRQMVTQGTDMHAFTQQAHDSLN